MFYLFLINCWKWIYDVWKKIIRVEDMVIDRFFFFLRMFLYNQEYMSSINWKQMIGKMEF